MPRLQTATVEAPATQFVASPALDMMNAMYFTGHVKEGEGGEGWPVELRREVSPDLLAELDFLFEYPAGDPGVLGIFVDNLWVHPETWRDVEALLSYIESMPEGIGELDEAPGIQGLVYQATFRYPDDVDRSLIEQMPHREAIEQRMRSLGDRDADEIMSWYDRPVELRDRIASLVRRFYQEHYEKEMARRLPALQRSVAKQRTEPAADAETVARRLTGRPRSCLEGGCVGPFERHIFAPSMDMGVYNSCAIVGDVHGLFYPLEPEFLGTPPDEAEEVRLARIYRALSDEQRLRILRMLREREMYAQEIVERTGLHQSVVSRHLSFMKAVGLLLWRRQDNMKFFSLNPAMRSELSRTLDLFEPAAPRK